MDRFIFKRNAFSLLIVSFLLGCSGMRQALQELKPVAPKLQLNKVALQHLSFQEITLGFYFRIHNPNPFSLSLTGFQYQLHVDSDQPLVAGFHNQPTTVPARGDSTFTLPVSLTFKKIFQLFQNAQHQDSIPYTFQAKFRVIVPVLGEVTIPVNHTGHIPIIRPPKIKIKHLITDRISWQGARLILQLELENANHFPLTFSQLEYNIHIQKQAVAQGTSQQSVQAHPHHPAVVSIPLELNFIQLGQSLYQMIARKTSLPLQLTGKITLATPLPLLKQATLPFQLQTTVALK